MTFPPPTTTPAPLTGAAATVASVATTIATFEPIIAPEVLLIMGIINAYRAAHNGQFPAPSQVDTTYKAVSDAINSIWSTWVPQGK